MSVHASRFTFHSRIATTMHVTSKTFIQDSAVAVQNKTLQTRLRVLTSFTVKRNHLFAELPDGEELRDRARQIKETTIGNLDVYLSQLEANVTRLGGVVHWARTGREAREIVLELA